MRVVQRGWKCLLAKHFDPLINKRRGTPPYLAAYFAAKAGMDALAVSWSWTPPSESVHVDPANDRWLTALPTVPG